MSFEVERNGARAVVKLAGELQLDQSRALYEALEQLAAQGDVREVLLDFTHLGSLDSSGIAVISLASDIMEDAGKALRVEHLHEGHREALALMPGFNEGFGVADKPPGLFESLGGWGFQAFDELLDYADYSWRLMKQTVGFFTRTIKIPKGSFIYESVSIGVDAFPIIALSSILMGLVLGFQAADQLTEFGGTVYVANLVGVSMAREFGPFMAGIILAGRSGSSIAAELGTMKVQEELDALRTMGLEPERHLALPKMLAITAITPPMTIMAMVLGMFGGLIIGVFYVDMSTTLYMMRTAEAVDPVDVWHGTWKSLVFAWLIGSIGSFCGFRIEGGASGVGRATTRAVVLSIFSLIIADAVATTLATFAGGWL